VCQIISSICTLDALRGRSRFWDHTFPQAEFTKDEIVPGSIDRNSRTSTFEKGGTNVEAKATTRFA